MSWFDATQRPIPEEFEVQLPAPAALSDALRIIGDAMKNEETRFNNLNTRAIAVVTATSVVTTLTGLAGKDILEQSQLPVHLISISRIGLGATLVMLVATIGLVVFNVLLPSSRLVFGDSAFTDFLPGANGGTSIELQTETDPGSIAYKQYVRLYLSLLNRNTLKAKWLKIGYLSLLVSIFLIAATTFEMIVRWGV